MRIVVFGASGVQGAHQIPVLTRAGHEVIGVSRNPKPLDIDGKSIEAVAADFNDHAVLSVILENADAIFLNLPSTSFDPSPPILAAAQAIGAAAKAASLLKECQEIKVQDDRREMRRLLRDSGVSVISIQPVVYLDNIQEAGPPSILDMPSHHDVDQLMLACLSRPDLAGRNIPIGGPKTIHLSELTEKLSRAWGRKLNYECQTVPDFCDKISKTMPGRGLETEKIVQQMFKAYTYYNEAEDKPFKFDMRHVLEDLKVELTPIEEWAKMRSVPGW
ncbi:NAD(P)-binding protein [Pleomassaria siparia CBS 279.74]|uniref:NAD(P)-binding protein n=1 Tax=Pleomassaria siparia CBS 279.74 TaxID=1314801 RepID=A0A6G1KL56_9PLEO|nr:NAD(P)-binding protein [Pleomassaria siparia CBS 279.74]